MNHTLKACLGLTLVGLLAVSASADCNGRGGRNRQRNCNNSNVGYYQNQGNCNQAPVYYNQGYSNSGYYQNQGNCQNQSQVYYPNNGYYQQSGYYPNSGYYPGNGNCGNYDVGAQIGVQVLTGLIQSGALNGFFSR
ncbi:hypothetical protein IV102_17785 [bacterium]|nr:hypothetical protein [bacterium]